MLTTLPKPKKQLAVTIAFLIIGRSHMEDKTELQKEVEQLERIRETWVWTLNNAVSRICEIDRDIKSLTEAKENEPEYSNLTQAVKT